MKELKKGFTTGSCAAAASKAAAFMLLSGLDKDEIEIITPSGISFQTKLYDIKRDGNSVSASVLKDGGDDPAALHLVNEFGGGPFEAVGNHLSVGDLLPNHGGAEADYHFVAVFPECRGVRKRGIGVPQEPFRIRPGEGSVVAEGADKAGSGSHLHAVFWAERDAAVQPGYGIHQRNRIVKGPEGVDADLESGSGEPFANGIGKAAAEHHNPVVQRNAGLHRGNGYAREKFHLSAKLSIFVEISQQNP